eukprot:12931428-Prorocentrum_lima.AAC.1
MFDGVLSFSLPSCNGGVVAEPLGCRTLGKSLADVLALAGCRSVLRASVGQTVQAEACREQGARHQHH